MKNRKFSTRYRIEKWFYEDSKEDAAKIAKFFIEGVSLVLLFAFILFLPAFFH